MASVLNFILSFVSFFLIGLVLSMFGGYDGSGKIGFLWLLLFLVPEVMIILKTEEVFSFLFGMHLVTVMLFLPTGIVLNLMMTAITGTEHSSVVTIVGGTALIQLICIVFVLIVEKSGGGKISCANLKLNNKNDIVHGSL